MKGKSLLAQFLGRNALAEVILPCIAAMGMMVMTVVIWIMYKFPFCKFTMASLMCDIRVDNFEVNGRSMCAFFWLGIDVTIVFYATNLILSFAAILFVVGYGILSLLTLTK